MYSHKLANINSDIKIAKKNSNKKNSNKKLYNIPNLNNNLSNVLIYEVN